MIIRSERKADIEAIFEITKEAFRNHPYSNQTEQFIVNALRAANALTISLVAEVADRVVGHVAFSPVTISGSSPDWYGLGPVSVLPQFQRQGIGQALIHEGLSLLKSMGARGCVLVGEPDYYNRFGFRSFTDLIFEGVLQKYVLALPFDEEMPRGSIRHHSGFSATS